MLMPGHSSRGCWSLLWLGFSWEKRGTQRCCACPPGPAMQPHIQQCLPSPPNEVTAFALCLLPLTLFLLYLLAGQRAEPSTLILRHLRSSTRSFPAPHPPTKRHPAASCQVYGQLQPPTPPHHILPVRPPSAVHVTWLGAVGALSPLLALACSLLIDPAARSSAYAFLCSLSQPTRPTTPARVSNTGSSCACLESPTCVQDAR